jgi:hypothetical protein
MQLKLLLGILIPGILIVLISIVGSLQWGFTSKTSFIESLSVSDNDLKMPITIGSTQVRNAFFLSQPYSTQSYVACLVDVNDAAKNIIVPLEVSYIPEIDGNDSFWSEQTSKQNTRSFFNYLSFPNQVSLARTFQISPKSNGLINYKTTFYKSDLIDYAGKLRFTHLVIYSSLPKNISRYSPCLSLTSMNQSSPIMIPLKISISNTRSNDYTELSSSIEHLKDADIVRVVGNSQKGNITTGVVGTRSPITNIISIAYCKDKLYFVESGNIYYLENSSIYLFLNKFVFEQNIRTEETSVVRHFYVDEISTDKHCNLYSVIDNKIFFISQNKSIKHVAGNGANDAFDDGVLAVNAGFFAVRNLAFDSDNVLYFTENGGNIRYIDSNGLLQTYVVNTNPNDDKYKTTSRFQIPAGAISSFYIDKKDTFYIVDNMHSYNGAADKQTDTYNKIFRIRKNGTPEIIVSNPLKISSVLAMNSNLVYFTTSYYPQDQLNALDLDANITAILLSRPTIANPLKDEQNNIYFFQTIYNPSIYIFKPYVLPQMEESELIQKNITTNGGCVLIDTFAIQKNISSLAMRWTDCKGDSNGCSMSGSNWAMIRVCCENCIMNEGNCVDYAGLSKYGYYKTGQWFDVKKEANPSGNYALYYCSVTCGSSHSELYSPCCSGKGDSCGVCYSNQAFEKKCEVNSPSIWSHLQSVEIYQK